MSKRKPSLMEFMVDLYGVVRAGYDDARKIQRRGFSFAQQGSAGRSGFASARRSRRDQNWKTSGASGNVELRTGLVQLRNKSRDVKRNNPYGRQALMTLASFGSLQWPQSAIEPRESADGTISDSELKRVKALNRQVDRIFALWSRDCMADGDGNFQTAQVQAVGGAFDSGESFTRQRIRRLTDGLVVPLQLEVLEGDFCDHTRNEALTNADGRQTGKIIQGIEFDAIGRRKLYHLYRNHPGEALAGLTHNLETVGIPAARIAHLYAKPFVRPGQVRGEPWLHAILRGLNDFAGLSDSERVRARGASSLMAVVKGGEGFDYDEGDDALPNGINPLRTADGTIVERLRPGTVAYAEDGQEIEFNRPPTFDGYKDQAFVDLHELAQGAGMPYELFTGDLSGTNFSSIMFGMGGFWRLMTIFQQAAVLPLWGWRVWGWFIDVGIAAGVLPVEAGPAKWVSTPFPQVDPIKQNKGKLIAVRGGWETLPDAIAETGKDPDEVLAEHVRVQKFAAENDLVLDGIPSTTTLAGQLQAEAVEAGAVTPEDLADDPSEEEDEEDADVDNDEDDD